MPESTGPQERFRMEAPCFDIGARTSQRRQATGHICQEVEPHVTMVASFAVTIFDRALTRMAK